MPSRVGQIVFFSVGGSAGTGSPVQKTVNIVVSRLQGHDANARIPKTLEHTP